jgi:hypothetical protein
MVFTINCIVIVINYTVWSENYTVFTKKCNDCRLVCVLFPIQGRLFGKNDLGLAEIKSLSGEESIRFDQ